MGRVGVYLWQRIVATPQSSPRNHKNKERTFHYPSRNLQTNAYLFSNTTPTTSASHTTPPRLRWSPLELLDKAGWRLAMWMGCGLAVDGCGLAVDGWLWMETRRKEGMGSGERGKGGGCGCGRGRRINHKQYKSACIKTYHTYTYNRNGDTIIQAT